MTAPSQEVADAAQTAPARVEVVTSWTVYPTGCDPESVNGRYFRVVVEYRGAGRYRVTDGFSELSRAGKWADHVPPFKRHQYRWDTFEQAQEWARKVVDDLVVNGRTWAQWQAFHAAKNTD